MASKKTSKARMGRPTKTTGAAATSQVNLRLTPADRALLDAIQAQEQGVADKLGLTLSPADTFRIILRREAERRGLSASMAQAS